VGALLVTWSPTPPSNSAMSAKCAARQATGGLGPVNGPAGVACPLVLPGRSPDHGPRRCVQPCAGAGRSSSSSTSTGMLAERPVEGPSWRHAALGLRGSDEVRGPVSRRANQRPPAVHDPPEPTPAAAASAAIAVVPTAAQSNQGPLEASCSKRTRRDWLELPGGSSSTRILPSGCRRVATRRNRAMGSPPMPCCHPGAARCPMSPTRHRAEDRALQHLDTLRPARRTTEGVTSSPRASTRPARARRWRPGPQPMSSTGATARSRRRSSSSPGVPSQRHPSSLTTDPSLLRRQSSPAVAAVGRASPPTTTPRPPRSYRAARGWASVAGLVTTAQPIRAVTRCRPVAPSGPLVRSLSTWGLPAPSPVRTTRRCSPGRLGVQR